MLVKDESLWAVVICLRHLMHSDFFDLTRLVRQLPQNLWLQGCTATGMNIISKHIGHVICSLMLFLKVSISTFLASTYYFFLFSSDCLSSLGSGGSTLVSYFFGSSAIGTDVSL